MKLKGKASAFSTAVLHDVESERLIGFDKFFGAFQIYLHNHDDVCAYGSVAPHLRQTTAILSQIGANSQNRNLQAHRGSLQLIHDWRDPVGEFLFNIYQPLTIVDYNHYTVRAFDASDLMDLVFHTFKINVAIAFNQIN